MDIFDFAMQMEKDGESYYRELAGKSKNKGLKNILNMLADDEVKHYETIKTMKKSLPTMQSTKILTNAKNIFVQMKEEKENFDFTLSQKELYKKAQELERKSEEFYTNKSKEMEDKSKKGIFLRIAEEEKKHYFILDNIIEFISRPESWLENAEFHHLDEY